MLQQVPRSSQATKLAESRDRRFGEVRLSASGELDALAPAWRAFEQVADCTPFQTFAWLDAWMRFIGTAAGTQPAIVLGHKPNGDLLFILPLAIERAMFSRRLVFLGHALCDYNAPLLAPDFPVFVPEAKSAEWLAACRRLLRQDPAFRHDAVVFDKMPGRVGGQANPLAALKTILHASGAHPVPLMADWDSFYAAKRSSTARRRDRSRRRRLEELGEVRFVTPTEPAFVQEAVNVLFEQKARSFARMGVRNLFAQPGHREFFGAAALAETTHVSRLDIGSRCAAVNLGLMFRGCYYHVLTTYDEDLARFGPGTVHLRELMRYAIAHRCHTFDFTVGDEPFKREWSDVELALYDHASGVNLVGFVDVFLLRLKLRAKRFIKHSPRLWALATRLRPLLASLKEKWARRAKPHPARGPI